jgi:hypothetical protein
MIMAAWFLHRRYFPSRPVTFDCGNETVGVDEADGQRTDLTPEE